MSELSIHRSSGGVVRFRVHVQPRASKSEIVGLHDTALKVRVTAPPADGAANTELIGLLSRSLGVPRRAVSVVAGSRARSKVVEVRGVLEEQVRDLAARGQHT